MIKFRLNNNDVKADFPITVPLLHVLRSQFSLMGSKEGCGDGECGACSVLIDDKLFSSCIVPIGNLIGKSVLTIEGFKYSKQFKVLDESFAECGAVQCGYCTPGMIMATQALLLVNPEPSIAEVKVALSGNLCRCTGYNMIIEAVLMAAREGKGLW